MTWILYSIIALSSIITILVIVLIGLIARNRGGKS